MSGRLIGIAVRPERYGELVEHDAVKIDPEGLVGDHARNRDDRPDRIVSILAAEDWAAACADLEPLADPEEDLHWLTRRANLLVEGIRLPRVTGAVLKIGDVELEVRAQTYPCKRMEDARPGLLKALAKDWRGGVLCKVITSGEISKGQPVEIVSSPPEVERRLP